MNEMQKTLQDMKMEMESRKKTHMEEKLEMKNLEDPALVGCLPTNQILCSTLTAKNLTYIKLYMSIQSNFNG